ncbi:copper resistance system multicopper oxidase [Falsiroseomonas sp.]|uniref:copper resistance system multicopper oxidase n=1 Tax=Falsiroseomonas sp. TaxID=2870721 RepID=UPI0027256C8C|nr:copper resistance system multicopper oxidase [Falsiroseomonas sp.]MDO9501415.1 copper resistance system multicopper oxidase [Falsiroseomonas sp.]
MTSPLSRRDSLKLAAAAGMAGVVTAFPGRQSFANAHRVQDLAVEATRITVDGAQTNALTIGGTVPGPLLHWREGEEVVIRVTNRLSEPTSIHWHGLLLAGVMDGAPGFNGYEAIQPGQTYTYRFQLRQAGTYWYHSHSAAQEQAGMYGAIVIEPARPEPVRVTRDYVVMLSDHSSEAPDAIFRNLRNREGYYNRGQRTLVDFMRDVRRDGWSATMAERMSWGEMRMDPTDLADVTGYQFLVNGRGPQDNKTFLFTTGERVRLRFINGSAMSIYDVAIPDLRMTVISADGLPVIPVPVDEFRIGVGETYDVVVNPTEARAFTIMSEPLDRSGYARATLAPRQGMEAPIPPRRPRTVLTMADMGMAHGGMAMGSGAMAGMDHSAMAMGGAAAGGSAMAGMNHGGMPMGGSGTGTAAPAPAAANPHAGHAMPGAAAMADPNNPLGWEQAGTPEGKRALRYADLRSTQARPNAPQPSRDIVLRLTGQMGRYSWSLNDRRFGMEEAIRVRQGDRVRIRFLNETMMAHPMHLHGMFMEMENGAGDRLPYKHVVLVRPGAEASVLLTADEVGDWPLHCHLLFHMEAGMMTRFIVEPARVASAG